MGSFESERFAPGDDIEERTDETLTAFADAWRGAIKQHMGIWRDLKVRKHETEVDVQIGQLVAIGRGRGVPTPINAAALEALHEIGVGVRGMDRENLHEIFLRSGLDSVQQVLDGGRELMKRYLAAALVLLTAPPPVRRTGSCRRRPHRPPSRAYA